ncbi:mannitol dehydrogenase family protein [Dactylosporangium sp. CA-233914]|uniref:mannitol dehydrogenase family protein n=1 Tax=Dactylosporangium sp. CA-233914 TaxID=3239934 RepID=UPI003D90E7E0
MRPAYEPPRYDRSGLSVGIVHFGVGNFHRSHQAMYLDRLFERGEDLDWAICGVGLLPGDRRMRDALAGQDMTYTLVERRPDGSSSPRTVGSIVEYLFGPDDPDRVLERLTDPATRIVSLTITEGGYNTSDTTGEFDASNPAVQQDLRPGAAPTTVFGYLVEGLARRRARGIPPFTVMSCDNLPGNGDVARTAFVGYARLRDPGLADWIAATVAFPNGMVDRITPITTNADREFVGREFGVTDAWPVLCEPFVQWVLEDHFTLGRPAFERVGVQVVADVTPYELMKLRLLNASHQALAYPGYLLGHRHAHEAAADPRLAGLLTRYMDEEATPTLQPVPGIDLTAYKRSLIERFTNPYIPDTLARLATDASDRIPKFLLPVVHDRVRLDQPTPIAALVVAAWAVFAADVTEPGAPDRQHTAVAAAVRRQQADPIGFLRDTGLFGDLAERPIFADAFATSYHDIRSGGIAAALTARLGTSPAAPGTAAP